MMAIEPRPEDLDHVQETQFTTSPNIVSGNQRVRHEPGYGSADRTTAVAPAAKQQRAPRAIGPDLLRGLVIVLQALDHASVGSGAWRHGVARESEADGQPVDEWNIPVGWTARMLTHLCAPAFMFLLGMGVVYFGRSRTKLGWSRRQLLQHFFTRAFVLALVNQVLGTILTIGRFWLLNVVLLALAVDYLLAGVLWLIVNESENALTQSLAAIPAMQDQDRPDREPLLRSETATTHRGASTRAASVSFHVHNALLFAITMLTIWWNIWLSRDGGHCLSTSNSVSTFNVLDELPLKPTLFEFMFYMVTTRTVVSGFPPLAWLSFAVLGLLYARILLHKPRSASAVASGTALAGVGFAVALVLTRLLHIGNLSEDCLHMPENVAHPTKNQYLVSFRAFFYTIKYPPDPAYMFYTMAVNMFLLALFSTLPPVNVETQNDAGSATKGSVGTKVLALLYAILLPFGQCALFFYSVHMVVYSALGAFVKKIWGHPIGIPDLLTGDEAQGIGNGPVFWIMYFSGLVILWFACRWYAGFKGSKGPNSLWRFF